MSPASSARRRGRWLERVSRCGSRYTPAGSVSATGFGFLEALARVERALVTALDLEPRRLDPRLALARGTWKGEPISIQTHAYQGSRIRYARCAHMQGAHLEIGNLLCLPALDMNLPIFGADLVGLGRETGMVAVDLSPGTRVAAARAAQIASLEPIVHLARGFPSGGQLPAWCEPWFSPHPLYTRIDIHQAPRAAAAFASYATHFIGLATSATPVPTHAVDAASAQDGYAAAHRTDDKGLGLLARIFGSDWATAYVTQVLFPVPTVAPT